MAFSRRRTTLSATRNATSCTVATFATSFASTAAPRSRTTSRGWTTATRAPRPFWRRGRTSACWCAMTRRASTSSIIPSSIRTAARGNGGDCSRPWRPRRGNLGSASPRTHPARPEGDRLALLRATRAQTSPVFAVWKGAEGIVDDARRRGDRPARCSGAASTGRSPRRSCCSGGLPIRSRSPRSPPPCASAELYVADGHHRYETAAAYAAERRAADADAPHGAPFERCLVYLAAADDPGMTILPTHRLVRPGPGIAFSLDDLWARLDDAFETVPAAMGVRHSPPRRRCTRPTTRSRWSRTMERRCSGDRGTRRRVAA